MGGCRIKFESGGKEMGEGGMVGRGGCPRGNFAVKKDRGRKRGRNGINIQKVSFCTSFGKKSFDLLLLRRRSFFEEEKEHFLTLFASPLT